MVDVGSDSLVDVGTDHAYLPIYLVKKGIIKSALAVDRLQGPLLNAKKNVEKYGVENQVSVKFSNGLSSVVPSQGKNIVMAGVGSENIINIIENAPWLKGGSTLILQPMTKEEILREYLARNFFRIIDEEVAVDSGKVYVAFKIKFCGEDQSFLLNDPMYIFFGSFQNRKITAESFEYLKKQKARMTKIFRGKNFI